MKKFILLFITLLLLALSLTACGVKVSFDIGDATLISGELEQKYKEDSPIVAPTLEKEGYVFDGWDKDFSAPTEEMTVSPLWKKIHTVTFDVADAVAEDSTLLSQSIVDGEGATEPKVTREGYVFDGWDGEFSTITGDTAITAKWKKIHTVTFYLDGGETNDKELLTQKVVDGKNAILPAVTKKNFNFKGWDNDVTAVKKDMTTKAIWERKTFSSTEIFELVNPATVELKTYRSETIEYSMGSGFFIAEDGTLLTNYHVIADSRRVVATTYNGKKYEVTKVLAYDIEKDIALLKVEANGTKFAYLEIAAELPKAGEAVWALGSSLGLTGTFSSGIVSHVNRDIDGVKFIQTTTPISSGNSGGPLVNEHGYVVGINSASYTEGQNLNLAVEISQYKDIKRVSMGVGELFVREATIRYWIGEKVIMETSKSQTSGQILSNGDTVHGNYEGGNYDVYMTKYPKGTSILVFMVRTNPEVSLESLLDYLYVFVSDDDVNDGVAYLSDDFFIPIGMHEDENGDSYYIGMVAVYDEFLELGDYVGVTIASDYVTEYQLFLYFITEEMAEKLK